MASEGLLRLKGMAFYGHHGVFEEEQRLGQRIEVDLVLTLSPGKLEAAGLSDRLEESVNYAQVYEAVRAVVEGERLQLMEGLAARILDRVLQAFPEVAEAGVLVRKPQPPVGGVMESFEVEMTRRR